MLYWFLYHESKQSNHFKVEKKPNWLFFRQRYSEYSYSYLFLLRRINRQKRRQRSSLLFGGWNSFNSMLHYTFSTRMIWRIGLIQEWTLGRMGASKKNGWSSCSHHIKPPPLQMDVLSKLIFKSSLLLNG